MRSTAEPHLLRVLLTATALLALGGKCAFAEACGRGYVQQHGLDLAKIVAKDGPVSNMWGRDNMRIVAGTLLRIEYPRGSFNPGADGAPVGGGGFKFAFGHGVTDACLTYSVRFPADFDFVKGGKLPGLYGGDAPRGCATAETAKGFSARLMWRAGGAGELYLYHPAQKTVCGESIGRGSWTFPRGQWVSVAEQVVMNRPGQADGTIRIWIDGRLKIEAGNLALDSAVDGLLFSTFFGGSDPSWASPKDQTAEFKDFSLGF